MLDMPGKAAAAPVSGAGVSGAGVSGARGVRLWGVLLVVDFFVVILFGGALGAKIYQHLAAPVQPVVNGKHARPVPTKPAPPVKATEAPKPAPAAPAAPAKPAPATPGKPAAKAAAKDVMPPPKPSLLTEAPRHEAAAPQTTAKTPPAAAKPTPAPEAKAKAVAVNFQISAPGAMKVDLAGPFIVRGGGKKDMKQKADGLWVLTLYLTPNTYRYHFLVDGKKTLDPQNPKTDHGASVISVP